MGAANSVCLKDSGLPENEGLHSLQSPSTVRKPRRRNSAAKTTEALQLSVPSENIDCDFSNYHKEIEECRLIILSGNVEKLKIFLCDTHFDLDALRFEGLATALHIAVSSGKLLMVKHLLHDSLINPLSVDKRGDTALQWADRLKKKDIAKYLRKFIVDSNSKSKKSPPPPNSPVLGIPVVCTDSAGALLPKALEALSAAADPSSANSTDSTISAHKLKHSVAFDEDDGQKSDPICYQNSDMVMEEKDNSPNTHVTVIGATVTPRHDAHPSTGTTMVPTTDLSPNLTNEGGATSASDAFSHNDIPLVVGSDESDVDVDNASVSTFSTINSSNSSLSKNSWLTLSRDGLKTKLSKKHKKGVTSRVRKLLNKTFTGSKGGGEVVGSGDSSAMHKPPLSGMNVTTSSESSSCPVTLDTVESVNPCDTSETPIHTDDRKDVPTNAVKTQVSDSVIDLATPDAADPTNVIKPTSSNTSTPDKASTSRIPVLVRKQSSSPKKKNGVHQQQQQHSPEKTKTSTSFCSMVVMDSIPPPEDGHSLIAPTSVNTTIGTAVATF